MKHLNMFKETKGIFKNPKKVYYLGKIKHGTPYFNPRNFEPCIISVRKLNLRSDKEIQKIKENKPYLIKKNKDYRFSNLPLVRRSFYKILNVFKNYYYIAIGWPFSIKTTGLGWKDKYQSPRFEWCPQFSVFFFKWQFCIWWVAPKDSKGISDNDTYYEMILWYLYYADKNLKKAKETWPWKNSKTNKSSWNNFYLKET